MEWKTLKSDTVLENSIFRVRKDQCQKQDGTVVEEYFVIDRPDVAIVVVVTEDDKLVLLNQYRYPIKKSGIEVPAGHIEPGEDPETGARRELKEETGYTVERMEKLYENYASIGLLNQKLHFFIGTGAKKTHEQKLDENEELEVVLKTWEETLKLLEEGEIQDIDSVAAVLLAKKHLGK